MNPLHDLSILDTIIPDVSMAYQRLKSHEGYGLYTSRGRFYNHTVFGRDASMSAKFVADFDHSTTIEVIFRLIALQGVAYNSVTQEAPGRIHHEWRDFRLWHGTVFDRVPFWLLKRRWDIQDHQLLTYFSLDTTAAFVRLVHKFATHVDASILERTTVNRLGKPVTVASALEAAAGWIMNSISSDGLVVGQRTNGFSLPVQTFQDSLYTRADGSLIDLSGPVAYIEVQAFAADALQDMAHLFPEHDQRFAWQETGMNIHRSMLKHFWQDDGYFSSVIDAKGTIDVANISVGWILNTFVWRGMSDEERERYIAPIVQRLFSDDFLTPIGLRTRARSAPDPFRNTVDYHGSETVWPMFSFMVVEGLRRHRLYDLADQLEHRIVNGLNAVGHFAEFHIIRRDGTVIQPSGSWLSRRLNVQMKQEKDIGFSVVPAIVMARRALNPPARKAQKDWQAHLERTILDSIPHVARAKSSEAINHIGKVENRHLRRWTAGLRTGYYFWKNRSRVSKLGR